MKTFSNPRGLALLELPPGRYLIATDVSPAANVAPPDSVVVSTAAGDSAFLRLFFSH